MVDVDAEDLAGICNINDAYPYYLDSNINLMHPYLVLVSFR